MRSLNSFVDLAMVIGIEAQYRVRRCKAGLAIIWWFKKKQSGIRPCVFCNISLCGAEGRIWDLCLLLWISFAWHGPAAWEWQLHTGSCMAPEPGAVLPWEVSTVLSIDSSGKVFIFQSVLFRCKYFRATEGSCSNLPFS